MKEKKNISSSGTVQQDWFKLSLTVRHIEAYGAKERQKLLRLLKKYEEYKTSFAKQIKFAPEHSNLGQ